MVFLGLASWLVGFILENILSSSHSVRGKVSRSSLSSTKASRLFYDRIQELVLSVCLHGVTPSKDWDNVAQFYGLFVPLAWPLVETLLRLGCHASSTWWLDKQPARHEHEVDNLMASFILSLEWLSSVAGWLVRMHAHARTNQPFCTHESRRP